MHALGVVSHTHLHICWIFPFDLLPDQKSGCPRTGPVRAGPGLFPALSGPVWASFRAAGRSMDGPKNLLDRISLYFQWFSTGPRPVLEKFRSCPGLDHLCFKLEVLHLVCFGRAAKPSQAFAQTMHQQQNGLKYKCSSKRG